MLNPIQFKERLTADDVKMEVVPDPETPEWFGDEEYERLEKGRLNVVGVRAVAKVHTKAGVIVHASSAGLWGICTTYSLEDEAYMKQIFEEEKETLLDELQRMEILPQQEV